jgi:hypothetical protein
MPCHATPCLTIPTNSVWTEWPVSGKNAIYIRDCYPKIYGLCQKAWDSACALVVLRGTPGVGKSLFLDYALAKLLSDNKIVMLVSGPDNEVFIYKSHVEQPEGAFTIEHARTNKLAAAVDYVLYDPHEDPQATQAINITFFRGKNILITVFPDPENCTKILKDAEQVSVLYIGPTDTDESESIKKSCYANTVSADELQRRFEEIGGIPRMLFQMKGPLPIEDYVDSVLQDISYLQMSALNDLAEKPQRIDFGTVASSCKSLWALYHLVPDKLFTSHSIEPSCENGLKLLRKRLLQMDVQKLWNLYYYTDDTCERLGTLRRIRFEAYAHKKILVHGIALTAMKLNANSVSKSTSIDVRIPAGSTTFTLRDSNVDNLATYRAQVHQMGGGYMLPDLSNYPVLDSAFVSNANDCFILQMKAGGKSKPLSDDKAAATVCSALGQVFVVVTPVEHNVTKKLAGAPAAMSQYVLILRETL